MLDTGSSERDLIEGDLMKRKRYVAVIMIIGIAVALSVLSCTMAGNDPPVIASLEAEAGRVFPSGSTQIVCTASDPDGDELTYEWWASGGEIDGPGATVVWRAPDSEGFYNIKVTVIDGRGGEVTDHIMIMVKANVPPVINNLTADADWTVPGGSLMVTCDAEDPDGHVLRYEWSTSAGHVFGTGPEIVWFAPEESGIYSITVVVDDDYGGSATGTLTISVATGQPPVIESLLVTAEHKYLKKTTSGYLVGEGKDFRIQCTASHPDGFDLSYEWECDGGEISGEGSIITWTAPNRGVYVTVTVVVSDVAGNMATKSVGLDVRSCSEFG